MTRALLPLPSIFGRLKGFISLLRRTVLGQWAYRGSILMSLLSNTTSYAVLVLVWTQVYSSGAGRAQELRADCLFAYLAVAFIINFVVSMMVEVRFGARLQTGMIALDVVRPLGCMPLHLAQALGEAVAGGIMGAVLYAVAFVAFGKTVLPPDWSACLLGAWSLCLAFFLNFSIGYLAAQALFVTQHYYGITQSRLALHYAFSGIAAPLALFPAALRQIANYLPFHHVVETPALITLGMVTPAVASRLLLDQLLWTCGLLLASSAVFRIEFKRHQILGG